MVRYKGCGLRMPVSWPSEVVMLSNHMNKFMDQKTIVPPAELSEKKGRKCSPEASETLATLLARRLSLP